MVIDKELLDKVSEQAKASPRLRDARGQRHERWLKANV